MTQKAKFVDAHVHLTDREYRGRVGELLDEAEKSDVVGLVSNSMDYKTSVASIELSKQYPGRVYAAVGIHPWNVGSVTEEEVEMTAAMILDSGEGKAKTVTAVGEIGLDYTYTKGGVNWDLQVKVFDRMLKAAEKAALPVIIHSRGTTADIVERLPSYNLRKVLLHWFSRPIGLLPTIVERGYLITEGPPTVYSSNIREIVKRVPLTNLLTETDGPVRFGDVFKGRMTSPAFIPRVVQAISEVKQLTIGETAAQILRNFVEFFGLNQSAFMNESA